jgi:hypothetical protein
MQEYNVLKQSGNIPLRASENNMWGTGPKQFSKIRNITMVQIKAIFLLTGILFFMTSCTEKIDIDLGTTFTRFVVEGAVTTDTMRHHVKLSKSIDYYSQTDIPAVSDAVVTIDDGITTVILEENDTLPGYYETPADYYGIPGRIYHLNIELQEAINGQTNYSASCLLNPVAPIDSINVVYKEEWEAWELQIYAWDPGAINFYSFYVYRNGDLVTDTINEIGISDDKYFNGNFTYGAPVYYFIKDDPTENVFPGDTITLQMGGITEEYYYFVYDVIMETFEYRNPLFSGPPANISTNITNGGMGFFTAYAVSYATTVYEE